MRVSCKEFFACASRVHKPRGLFRRIVSGTMAGIFLCTSVLSPATGWAQEAGVALPLPQQPVGNMKIDGFLPVIINIAPVNIPLLLGMAQESPAEGAASTDSPQAPADIREKVYTGREENISWLN